MMPYTEPSDDEVAAVLTRVRRIAIVGLSDKPHRPSHQVAEYLVRAGYEIIPVNPTIESALGVPAVASLAELPGPVDMICVFRRSEETADVAREAVAAKTGAQVFWLQQRIFSEEAAAIANDAGMMVVMDRCAKIEHARLLG